MSKKISNIEVIDDFIRGRKDYNGQHMNLSIQDFVLKSYNKPIAVHTCKEGYDFIIIDYGVSVTTNKHRRMLMRELDSLKHTYYHTSEAKMMENKK